MRRLPRSSTERTGRWRSRSEGHSRRWRSGGLRWAATTSPSHTAIRLLSAGRASELYDHAAVSGVQDALLGGRVPGFYDAFRNPPFYTSLFAPLALLDLLPGFAVFAVLSTACLALALSLLLRNARLLRDALLLGDAPRLRER